MHNCAMGTPGTSTLQLMAGYGDEVHLVPSNFYEWLSPFMLEMSNL